MFVETETAVTGEVKVDVDVELVVVLPDEDELVALEEELVALEEELVVDFDVELVVVELVVVL